MRQDEIDAIIARLNRERSGPRLLLATIRMWPTRYEMARELDYSRPMALWWTVLGMGWHRPDPDVVRWLCENDEE